MIYVIILSKSLDIMNVKILLILLLTHNSTFIWTPCRRKIQSIVEIKNDNKNKSEIFTQALINNNTK